MKPKASMRNSAFSIATLALASTTQAQTTKTALFLPFAGYNEVSWSGSIIGACSDSTTYALRCSGTPIVTLPASVPIIAASAVAAITSAASDMCDAKTPPYIITEGPSGYAQARETMIGGIKAMWQGSCVLSGMTSASCIGTDTVTSDGMTATSAATSVLTGDQFPIADVTITAGVQKLAKATDNVCKSGAADKSIPVVFQAVALFLGVCGVFAL